MSKVVGRSILSHNHSRCCKYWQHFVFLFKTMYVYALLDKRFKGNYNNPYCNLEYKPFYIGSGSGCRIDAHIKKRDFSNVEKEKLINILYPDFYEAKILFDNISEQEALNLEDELILHYGRIFYEAKGILTNIRLSTEIPTKRKKVYKYTKGGIFTGEVYNSVREAARKNDCGNQGISSCALGKKLHYKEYIWRYYKKDRIDPGFFDNGSIQVKRKENYLDVSIYNKDTGKYIKTYSYGVPEAVKDLNLPKNAPSNIANCLNGKKRQAYGYIWNRKKLNKVDSNKKKPTSSTKIVLEYNTNGEIINKWLSIKSAAKDLEISKSALRNNILGKSKRSDSKLKDRLITYAKGPLIFIPGNVPSSKNNRIWTGKFLVESKAVKKWKKETADYWFIYKQFFKNTKDFPVKVGIHFVRGTRHKYDWVNPVQTIQDEMVNNEWIDDDNTSLLIPTPFLIDGKYDSYCKENPGVFIKIMN